MSKAWLKGKLNRWLWCLLGLLLPDLDDQEGETADEGDEQKDEHNHNGDGPVIDAGVLSRVCVGACLGHCAEDSTLSPSFNFSLLIDHIP